MDKNLLSIEDKERLKDHLYEIKNRVEELKHELNIAENKFKEAKNQLKNEDYTQKDENKEPETVLINEKQKQNEINKIKSNLEQLLVQLEKKEKYLKETQQNEIKQEMAVRIECQKPFQESCSFAIENQANSLFLSVNELEQVCMEKGFNEKRQTWIVKYKDKPNNIFSLKNCITGKYLESNRCGVTYTNVKTNNMNQLWIFKDLKIQNADTKWFLESRENKELVTRPENISHFQNWVVHREKDVERVFQEKKIWKSRVHNIEYVKIDCCNWIKTENGKIKFRYQFISENKDHIILINTYTKKFVKLGEKYAKFGCSLDKIDNLFDAGKWISPEEYKEIEKSQIQNKEIEEKKTEKQKKALEEEKTIVVIKKENKTNKGKLETEITINHNKLEENNKIISKENDITNKKGDISDENDNSNNPAENDPAND